MPFDDEDDQLLPAGVKAARNFAEFMEHGPGLRLSTRTWTVARDRTHGLVLRGGLGAFGCGEMWMRPYPHWADEPEWEMAPERDASNEACFDILMRED